MRDGIELATDVHFPRRGIDGGPYPAILVRTPYGKQRVPSAANVFTSAGYVVAIQDVRGRHDSDGEWYPLFNEGPDGYDAIEWLAAQDWCNGRVGTTGGSYPGWVQWAAARERPPHLQAMAVSAPAGWFGRQEMYSNGILCLGNLGWLALCSDRVLQHCSLIDWRAVFTHLPIRDMDAVIGRDMKVWKDWLDHPRLDEYWTRYLLTSDDFSRINLPVLHITGWFDGNLGGTLYFYEGMRAHSLASDRQALMVGPWDHGSATGDEPQRVVGEVQYPPESFHDLGHLRVRWFDRWLKDEPSQASEVNTASRVYVTGSDRWLEDKAWPPLARTRTWYLHSGGRANSLVGDGELSPDPPGEEVASSYTYDPNDPVILEDDWDFYGWITDPVPPRQLKFERRALEGRDDALVYTSPVLAEAVEVVGCPEVVLFCSSNCPDTDWFVWLNDVTPSGASHQVATGQLRARFRESLSKETLMEPGRCYEFRMQLAATGHSFLPDHRIRLVVSSSNFPLYDRNQNTGHPIGADAEMRVATNCVHQDTLHPSRLLLPEVETLP
jgi:uncharacterized protein